MKNLLFIFSLSFFILFSCSSGDDASSSNDINSILLKKMEDQSGYTIEIAYNGNKLDRTFSGDTHIEWTYSGDLITSEQHYSNGQLDFQFTFQYTNGKLSRWEKGNGIDIWDYKNFSYPDDKIRVVGINQDSYSLGHFDSNGNIYKWEDFLNDQLQSTTIITYDNKNNPNKNVIGYNALYYGKTYNNNVLKEEIFDSNGATISTYTYDFEYNDQNFPTLHIHNDGSGNWFKLYY